MKIQVHDASIGSLLGVFSIGFLLASTLISVIALGEIERSKLRFDLKLIEISKCPENTFQELAVSYPNGSVYRCGAVRSIPVHEKELEKWYKEEAKRLLKPVEKPRK